MEKLIPQCGICKKFYSAKDDDGTGLCPTCRPIHCPPLINHKELVQPGKFGVTNTQLIPEMKKAIEEEDLETLQKLKATYYYIFARSIKYLKKQEREYIDTHINNH